MMIGMTSAWVWAYSTSYSYEINFAPMYTAAQATLNEVSGEGLHYAGLSGYRYRPTPSGAEQSVSLGSWPNWPNYLYVDRMTSITFALALGSSQEAKLLGNAFFWG